MIVFKDGHSLYTAPCGMWAKCPSERRIPVYEKGFVSILDCLVFDPGSLMQDQFVN